MKEFMGILPYSLAYRSNPDRYSAPSGSWRAWGFRAWRLERYFATYPPVWLNPPKSEKG
jgi:hypothetical protein